MKVQITSKKQTTSTKAKNPQAAKTPVKKESLQRYSFFEDVWEVVRQVPVGRVTTYGAIARYLGSGISARMVGWAMNAAHNVMPPVPAQRVVNRNGMLSGKHHFSPPSSMGKMLRSEGLKITKDTVVDFKKHYWDPYEALSL